MNTEEINRFYSSIKESAFRLEALPEYDVADNGRFASFVRGEPKPESDLKNAWQSMIRSHVSNGKKWERARLFEGSPTPYVRYELEWGYVDNTEAGESIYIVDGDLDSDVATWLGKDFWLFDEEAVVWMEYDEQGRIVDRRLSTDPNDVLICVEIKNKLVSTGKPYKKYMTNYEPQLI